MKHNFTSPFCLGDFCLVLFFNGEIKELWLKLSSQYTFAHYRDPEVTEQKASWRQEQVGICNAGNDTNAVTKQVCEFGQGTVEECLYPTGSWRNSEYFCAISRAQSRSILLRKKNKYFYVLVLCTSLCLWSYE